MIKQTYDDHQPFPLEKRPKADLVPLIIPPRDTQPAVTTTEAPCDLTPYLCGEKDFAG